LNSSFRAIRNKHVPIKIQGIIYYSMLNRKYANKDVIKACEKAIKTVSSSSINCKMLTEFVTTDHGIEYICDKYFISRSWFYKIYNKYVIEAYRNIILL